MTRKIPDQAADVTSNKTRITAEDGFEEWHDVTCRNYSRSEFKRDSDTPFSANIVLRPFGALGLTDGWSDGGAATLTRSPSEFRRDSRDHFTLFYVTKGEIGIEQEDRQAVGKPGDFFIYDQARPIVLEFKPVYRAWMLGIPRPMLETRIVGTRSFTARPIDGASKVGRLVGSIVSQLDDFGADTNPGVIDLIGNATLDLVAAALAAEAGGTIPGSGSDHRLLGAAVAFMRANLDEATLDLGTIARRLNSSPRSLNRAFATQGTTPMRWLWRQRLEACNRALAEGRVRKRHGSRIQLRLQRHVALQSSLQEGVRLRPQHASPPLTPRPVNGGAARAAPPSRSCRSRHHRRDPTG